MKFQFLFYDTALTIAIEKGDPEMVSLLLSRPETDINFKSILNPKLLISF